MEKISITRALAELKRLDDRIGRAVREGQFIALQIGKEGHARMHGPIQDKQKVAEKIQSSFDTVNALIERRTSIKSAIVKSNATTVVSIAGKTMTVAEAIEYKSFIGKKVDFLNVLRQQYVANQNLMNTQNQNLEALIAKNLETVYGNEKGKVAPEMVESISKPQRDQKEAALFDPQNIVEKITALDEEISAVQTELDFILSESNARTEIEV